MSEFFQHTINGLSLGSIYALIALGYTMVYGILKLINFAHSDVYMMGAFFAYYSAFIWGEYMKPGLGFLVTLILTAMAGCAILGLMIERLAYKPLRNAPKLNLLITAIGVSLFLENFAQAVFGADPKVFPTVIANVVLFNIGAIEIRSLDVTVLGITLVTMLLLNFVIYKTRAGKAMRAVSQNMRVSSLMGINPNRVITLTFMMGSALAGIASVLVGMKYPKIDPLMGMMFGLKAFVAAVLGGIGSLGGAVIGGLIMGLSESMVVAYMSSTYRDALAFGILIIILIFKPSGIMGKSSTEKV